MTSVTIRDQGVISADDRKTLYRRHRRGAYVRSYASLMCWSLAALFYKIDQISFIAFTGVSVFVLYLILMNPPTLLMLRHVQNKTVYKYASLGINFLEIIGYTAIIYYVGGVESSNLTLLYAALIAYVGAVASRSLSFIIAALCAGSFVLMVALVYLGIIPDHAMMPENTIPLNNQILIVTVSTGLLFVVAFISSYTGGLLARSRKKLELNNNVLAEANRQLQEEIARSAEFREKLGESEKIFRTITENLQEMIAILDLNGVYTYLSPSNTKFSGYSLDDLLGKSGFDFLHPDDMKRIQSELAESLLDIRPRTTEMRYRLADGTYRWIESIGAPVFDEEGSLCGIVLSSRDISERKETESRLQASEEQFRSVSMYARDGIVVTNSRGKFIFCNAAVEKIMGYAKEELLGRSALSLFSTPENRAAYKEKFVKWRESGDGKPAGRNEEVRLRRKDGEEIIGEVSISDVLMDNQWHTIGIFRDVSERKNMEEQLRQYVQETDKMNQLMRGRENRILELKVVVNDLLIRMGEAPRYASVADRTDQRI